MTRLTENEEDYLMNARQYLIDWEKQQKTPTIETFMGANINHFNVDDMRRLFKWYMTEYHWIMAQITEPL